MSRSVVAISLLTLFLVSCGTKPVPVPEVEPKGENLMRYAHNVAVYEANSGYRMEVLNPWDTAVLLGSFFIPEQGFGSVICLLLQP